jgi:IS30 family transposase
LVEERIEIADLHQQKLSVRQIAARLQRSPSTVSRELRRNGHPRSGDYRPWAAQRRAVGRRARPKPGKLSGNARLRRAVQGGLREDGVRNRSANGCGSSSPSGRRCT